jgi:hypothetical protein
VDTETSSRRSTHNRRLTSGQGRRSARCGESRTPGAGRRPRETPGGNTGTRALGRPHHSYQRRDDRADRSPGLADGVPLPPYAHELNPVEQVWSHLKRSLANLTKTSLAQLTELLKTRLRRMQYRPGLLGGFLASTHLDLTPFNTPRP